MFPDAIARSARTPSLRLGDSIRVSGAPATTWTFAGSCWSAAGRSHFTRALWFGIIAAHLPAVTGHSRPAMAVPKQCFSGNGLRNTTPRAVRIGWVVYTGPVFSRTPAAVVSITG